MQGHTPPLSRLVEDQPQPHCPSWCTDDHAFGVHASESHRHGDMSVWLLQPITAPEPRIYISTVSFPPAEAVNYAHMFAMLDQPELAATVKRLGELAEADALFGLDDSGDDITDALVPDVAQPSDLPVAAPERAL